MATEYGLLLPHFGPETDRDRIIGGARRAEQMAFDSVWVRDHLVFHPHGMEGTDNTFIDPFVVLATLGAATTKVKLGFGSLIPHRPRYAARWNTVMAGCPAGSLWPPIASA